MGFLLEGPPLGILGIVAMLLVMFLCRMPASFAMALVGFLGMVVSTSWAAAIGTIGSEFWGVFSNYGLTVIPMFILVGETGPLRRLQRQPLLRHLQVVRTPAAAVWP